MEYNFIYYMVLSPESLPEPYEPSREARKYFQNKDKREVKNAEKIADRVIEGIRQATGYDESRKQKYEDLKKEREKAKKLYEFSDETKKIAAARKPTVRKSKEDDTITTSMTPHSESLDWKLFPIPVGTIFNTKDGDKLKYVDFDPNTGGRKFENIKKETFILSSKGAREIIASGKIDVTEPELTTMLKSGEWKAVKNNPETETPGEEKADTELEEAKKYIAEFLEEYAKGEGAKKMSDFATHTEAMQALQKQCELFGLTHIESFTAVEEEVRVVEGVETEPEVEIVPEPLIIEKKEEPTPEPVVETKNENVEKDYSALVGKMIPEKNDETSKYLGRQEIKIIKFDKWRDGDGNLVPGVEVLVNGSKKVWGLNILDDQIKGTELENLVKIKTKKEEPAQPEVKIEKPDPVEIVKKMPEKKAGEVDTKIATIEKLRTEEKKEDIEHRRKLSTSSIYPFGRFFQYSLLAKREPGKVYLGREFEEQKYGKEYYVTRSPVTDTSDKEEAIQKINKEYDDELAKLKKD